MPPQFLSVEDILRTFAHKDISDDVFRPSTFDEYVGQEDAKDMAKIMIKAAKLERRSLPNIMIDGAYGHGKSTLARLIAQAYGIESIIFSDGSSANKNPPKMGTVVIDEIHNLDAEITDILDITLDTGKLHIIGCTTNPGALPSPFRSRFRNIHLEPYTIEDLTVILGQAIAKRRISTIDNSLETIARRSRYNPRQATIYLSFMFDLMAIEFTRVLNNEIIQIGFNKLGVDELGLTKRDYRYMDALPNDRAVGLQYLSSRIHVDMTTIEEEIEPYLMQLGKIDRTSRGRVKIES